MSRKILLIEDDGNLVASLTRHLRRAGYDVVAAGDGSRGLEAVQSENPDVILLDLGLPGLDSFRVLHELDMLPEPIPVFVATGDACAETERRLLMRGVLSVFHKPFDVAELIVQLDEVLDLA